MRWDKGVEEARPAEADGDKNHGQQREYETDNVQRVHAVAVEEREGEAQDDRKDGGCDVAQQRAPEEGDVPVFAGGDDEVQVK